MKIYQERASTGFCPARSSDIASHWNFISISSRDREVGDLDRLIGDIDVIWYLPWWVVCFDINKDALALDYTDAVEVGELGV